MDDSRQRELIHAINNLVGTVYAQVAAARAAGSSAAALHALGIVERAAQRAEAVVERLRQRGHERSQREG